MVNFFKVVKINQLISLNNLQYYIVQIFCLTLGCMGMSYGPFFWRDCVGIIIILNKKGFSAVFQKIDIHRQIVPFYIKIYSMEKLYRMSEAAQILLKKLF